MNKNSNLALVNLELSRAGQTLLLFGEKAVFWKEQQILILSDLHLGKSHHFQRNGIPLPDGYQDLTLSRLEALITFTQASRVFFLGDLFHSKYNPEWEYFRIWVEQLKSFSTGQISELRLVKGNHDILPESIYQSAGLKLCDHWTEGPFLFLHDRDGAVSKKLLMDRKPALCFSGHKHPGVRIKTSARESIPLPCFHFTVSDLILPAFGDLTGLHLITPNNQDEVYAIAEGELFLIPNTSLSTRNSKRFRP